MNTIKGFQGEFRFLSNFYPCKVIFDRQEYLSSEAAYQAQKTLNIKLRERFSTVDARSARQLGRTLNLRKEG
jgi:predicted NAD-dependent protein-ADP-ribosyltransferase YbiA (DUF1768 family)